jgi:hypothetical protein
MWSLAAAGSVSSWLPAAGRESSDSARANPGTGRCLPGHLVLQRSQGRHDGQATPCPPARLGRGSQGRCRASGPRDRRQARWPRRRGGRHEWIRERPGGAWIRRRRPRSAGRVALPRRCTAEPAEAGSEPPWSLPFAGSGPAPPGLRTASRGRARRVVVGPALSFTEQMSSFGRSRWDAPPDRPAARPDGCLLHAARAIVASVRPQERRRAWLALPRPPPAASPCAAPAAPGRRERPGCGTQDRLRCRHPPAPSANASAQIGSSSIVRRPGRPRATHLPRRQGRCRGGTPRRGAVGLRGVWEAPIPMPARGVDPPNSDSVGRDPQVAGAASAHRLGSRRPRVPCPISQT